MSKAKVAKPAKPAAEVAKPSEPAKPAAEPIKEYGSTRTQDVPWDKKKAAVLGALKKLGKPATTAEAVAVAETTPREIRHYCYHAAAAKLVTVIKTKGKQTFELTPAGAEALATYCKTK